MVAGGSAARRAQEARSQERLLREQWQAARERARRWEAASEGERDVAAQLLVLAERGWRLLVDRRWPGTRAANVDMLLVGPGGVFVLDVKNWRAQPEVSDGTLYAGGVRREEHVTRLLSMTKAAEDAVASLGLSPVAVQPLMVFAGRRLDTTVDRVRLLGEREVGTALLRERKRLRAEQVRVLADHLARFFPEYEPSTASEPRPRETHRELEHDSPTIRVPSPREAGQDPPSDGLFDLDGLRDAAVEEAMRAPIEQWMTFLHPDQVGLVRRNWSGPARVSGPAGTGKTVVGLHRAAHLAQRTNGRVLYVTFANNLPRVQRTFLTSMSPSLADRVEFSSLHSWAQEYLRTRGVATRLHREKATTAFSHAWMRAGRESCLTEVESDHRYWQEEIDHVIKGRGITTFEEYAHLRRTSLRRAHREAVWSLYEAYEANRRASGVHDFNDVLALALAEAQEADSPLYAAVVVDEVQDLTLVGVRLLHALVGDTPNGLLLIGDGQQAVYPGGFRLSDAGVDIRGGRAQVLRTNYRNSEQILAAALAVVADDSFEDLDGERLPGSRDVDLTYHDGCVHRVREATGTDHDRELLTALGTLSDDERADAAVLCQSTKAVAHYHRLLDQAGFAVCPLEQYDGHRVEALKLGTYRRAKGLEFKRVYLPHHDAALETPHTTESDHERQELTRSQLFVAMTRARDHLWLGSVAG